MVNAHELFLKTVCEEVLPAISRLAVEGPRNTSDEIRFQTTIMLCVKSWAALYPSPAGVLSAFPLTYDNLSKTATGAERKTSEPPPPPVGVAEAVRQSEVALTFITQFTSQDQELLLQVLDQLKSAQISLESALGAVAADSDESATKKAKLLRNRLALVRDLVNRAIEGNTEAWQRAVDISTSTLEGEPVEEDREEESFQRPQLYTTPPKAAPGEETKESRPGVSLASIQRASQREAPPSKSPFPLRSDRFEQEERKRARKGPRTAEVSEPEFEITKRRDKTPTPPKPSEREISPDKPGVAWGLQKAAAKELPRRTEEVSLQDQKFYESVHVIPAEREEARLARVELTKSSISHAADWTIKEKVPAPTIKEAPAGVQIDFTKIAPKPREERAKEKETQITPTKRLTGTTKEYILGVGEGLEKLEEKRKVLNFAYERTVD